MKDSLNLSRCCPEKSDVFVTISCRRHYHFFGEMVQEETRSFVKYTAIGHIANSCFLELPVHFPNVHIYESVIMPNHIHGLISVPLQFQTLQTHGNDRPCKRDSLSRKMSWVSSKMTPLSVLIRSYKSVVTRLAHEIDPEFAWENGFYDIWIRDRCHFDNVKNYIRKNPERYHRSAAELRTN